MRRMLQVLVLTVFMVSVFFVSPIPMSDLETEAVFDNTGTQAIISEYVPRDVRVAIYDEPNMTAPTYATSPGAIRNNATGLMDILVNYGYDVTLLDVHDIYNYELTTANYDVLCLTDNYPRENITYRVMDFWLGGGGLLVFDGSAGFLCSFGILPPEALGTSGVSTYWGYTSDSIVLTARHPAAKSLSGTIS
ncbi:MAG: hypothetical protein RTU30_15200, partial [Candidatus Thorarchaeota archaeon]